MQASAKPDPRWCRRRTEKQRRLAAVLKRDAIVEVLETLIGPGDRVVLEGNNQKQADYLSRMLAEVDPERVNGIHLIMPSVSRPEHLDLFERGIARKLDFAYAGAPSHFDCSQ